MNNIIKKIMKSSPVIPVLTIHRLEDALPLAEALINGGLKVLEITLRTPVALKAIAQIKASLPDAIIGAGTVLNTNTLYQALDAGVEFVVSPGSTPTLISAAKSQDIPILPGVNTPTEIMALLEQDITAMKFFPAQAAGGTAMLKAISAPLPQALFCPTGGITPANALDYLALDNVACVGGSWMVSENLIQTSCWLEIQRLAQEAAKLGL